MLGSFWWVIFVLWFVALQIMVGVQRYAMMHGMKSGAVPMLVVVYSLLGPAIGILAVFAHDLPWWWGIILAAAGWFAVTITAIGSIFLTLALYALLLWGSGVI